MIPCKDIWYLWNLPPSHGQQPTLLQWGSTFTLTLMFLYVLNVFYLNDFSHMTVSEENKLFRWWIITYLSYLPSSKHRTWHIPGTQNICIEWYLTSWREELLAVWGETRLVYLLTWSLNEFEKSQILNCIRLKLLKPPTHRVVMRINCNNGNSK